MGSKSGELSSWQNFVRWLFILCNIPIVVSYFAIVGILTHITLHKKQDLTSTCV